jgi:hypothetical protein
MSRFSLLPEPERSVAFSGGRLRHFGPVVLFSELFLGPDKIVSDTGKLLKNRRFFLRLPGKVIKVKQYL